MNTGRSSQSVYYHEETKGDGKQALEELAMSVIGLNREKKKKRIDPGFDVSWSQQVLSKGPEMPKNKRASPFSRMTQSTSYNQWETHEKI